jgi:hypothetical protein
LKSNPVGVLAWLVLVLLRRSSGIPVQILPERDCIKILKMLCLILSRSFTEDLVEILVSSSPRGNVQNRSNTYWLSP